MKGGVAIVTGGGTGIGAAVVRRLAERGVRSVINYAHSRDEAEALAAELGDMAMAVQADIVDDAQCRTLVQAAMMPGVGSISWSTMPAGRSSPTMRISTRWRRTISWTSIG
jgi:3-oxoacyl-[acyl-carrier protein] reductase